VTDIKHWLTERATWKYTKMDSRWVMLNWMMMLNPNAGSPSWMGSAWDRVEDVVDMVRNTRGSRVLSMGQRIGCQQVRTGRASETDLIPPGCVTAGCTASTLADVHQANRHLAVFQAMDARLGIRGICKVYLLVSVNKSAL
jgi:hypothetical protein